MASLFLFAGIFLAHIFLEIRRVQKKINSLGSRTQGRVIGHIHSKNVGTGPGFYTVFRSNWKGEERYIRSALPSLYPEFENGQEVELKFNEESPPRAYAPAGVIQHLSLATLVAAILFFALGLWLYDWGWALFIFLLILVIAIPGSGRSSKSKRNSTRRDHREIIEAYLFRPCLSHEEVATFKFLPLSLIQEKRNQYEQWGRTFALLTLVVGAGWVILTGREIEKRYRFVTSAQKAVGHVVPLNLHISALIMSPPPVRFRLPASEKEVQVALPAGTYPTYYRGGDKVEVLYDPKQPGSAMVNWGIGNFLGPSLFLLCGLLFFTWSLRRYLKLNP